MEFGFYITQREKPTRCDSRRRGRPGGPGGGQLDARTYPDCRRPPWYDSSRAVAAAPAAWRGRRSPGAPGAPPLALPSRPSVRAPSPRTRAVSAACPPRRVSVASQPRPRRPRPTPAARAAVLPTPLRPHGASNQLLHDPYKQRFVLRDRCPVCLSVCLSVCNVGVLWSNSSVDQDATWYGGRPRPRRHCVRRGPSRCASHSPVRTTRRATNFCATGTSNGSPYATGPSSCLSVLSVTLVYCGQTVGWIRMPLGTEVGLGPGDILLDVDPAPPH